MRTNLVKLLFSYGGRIPRHTFLWTTTFSAAIFLILFVFFETMVSRGSTWILYPPLFWVIFNLAIKRLHDAGSQAAWLLVIVIPVLGPVWLIWRLFFRRGSSGENQYGDDPLAYGDYLTVDIHLPGAPP